MQFSNTVGKTPTSFKLSHPTLAFNYCSLNLTVIYSQVSSRATDSPESVASVEHISDWLMLNPVSCFFPVFVKLVT